MNSIKGIVSILLILLTALLAKEGVELWSLGTNVDGDGIGVHFLGFEINDRVPEASIPSYAIGFFVTSAITLLMTITVIGRRFLKSK
ncbi:hypothetical protein M3204_17395 [Mesobacillus subterraneus]|uniref:hypothetical protein n=1 Tax=Mesobacillus subterraneus TaxID=285983 RepID=UPI00203F5511|nr:hypothetical protein [Mesobacillus subterraneus]MCM3666197.1 hypothetical protein [Mesobacillus subterraneus]MCM3685195.1 hypothetical protein [Mesobacillus subterraneus]